MGHPSPKLGTRLGTRSAEMGPESQCRPHRSPVQTQAGEEPRGQWCQGVKRYVSLAAKSTQPLVLGRTSDLGTAHAAV